MVRDGFKGCKCYAGVAQLWLGRVQKSTASASPEFTVFRTATSRFTSVAESPNKLHLPFRWLNGLFMFIWLLLGGCWTQAVQWKAVGSKGIFYANRGDGASPQPPHWHHRSIKALWCVRNWWAIDHGCWTTFASLRLVDLCRHGRLEGRGHVWLKLNSSSISNPSLL